MTTPLCRYCGDSKDMHHQFEPYVMPRGCKCDARDWGNLRAVPPVCADWQGPDGEGLCGNCEHLTECHAAKGAA